MFRLQMIVVIALTITFNSVFAVNQVRVFVPEDSLHGAQELRIGHESELYIEITCDKTIKKIGFIIEENKTNNAIQAWDYISYADVYHVLYHHNNWSYTFDPTDQHAPWPDTLTFRYTSKTIQNYLQAGTHQIARLAVTPNDIDEIYLSMFDYYFIDSLGDTLIPSIISEPITIIEDYDCNQNMIPDYIDIKNNHLLDCNDNGQIDNCEGEIADCNSNGVPDECDFDCNFNGIPDDCEPYNDCNCNGISDNQDISSGYTEDTNNNGVPDFCENISNHYYRIVVPANEHHGPQEMKIGHEEDIYIFAHTNYNLSGALVYADFEWSSGMQLWDYIDGEILLPYEFFDLIKTVNYFGESNNFPDTLEGVAISLSRNYQSPGDFAFIKLTVIPTDTGTVVVSNSKSPTSSDSSLFRADQSQLLYVPIYAEDIIVTEFPDCNNNGILDSIDIIFGRINDCNNNFIADYCEANDYPELDCNNNDLIDACEIAVNSSLDCNSNGILDICDIISNPELDCNNNGVLDGCDILSFTSEDCNLNSIPDECEFDCNLNGIPDDCETIIDCNCNAVADDIDISTSWSFDSDNNSIPDECEGKAGNYIRMYAIGSDGAPTNQIPINTESDIIISLTSIPEVTGVVIPLSPISIDNNRMWDYLSNSNIEYLYKDYLGYIGISSLEKQYVQWPDSLLLSATKYITSAPFPSNNTMPIIRMHITPKVEGEISWQSIHIPPSNDLSYSIPNDNTSYPLSLRLDNMIVGCCRGFRGNIDYDNEDLVDISDIVYLVQFMFASPKGLDPYCVDEADFDKNGIIDITDLVYLVSFLFQEGDPPLSCQN